MELFHASRQWAERPDDEKFRSLEEMHKVTRDYADRAREKDVPWESLRVEGVGDELTLVGKAAVPAKLTNYAFGQIASRVKAPAAYLQSLPATLAAQNLNHGLKEKADGNTQATLLFHQNDGLVLRAVTSDRYERIWNHEIISRLIDLSQKQDLEPARQTFRWDGAQMSDAEIAAAPKSLYASDHDMFAFLMSRTKDVTDPVGQTLRRGIIVTNSEVGDCALSLMGFWFRDVCCNHIIWGATNLATLRIAHVGEIRGKFDAARVVVRKYLESSTSFEKAKFQEFTKIIATNKEQVVETLFSGAKSIGLTKGLLEKAYEAVVPEEDGDPRSVWGFAQGITRVSQQSKYADARTETDRAVGKLLDVEF